MATYKVLQDIEAEDKLIGALSLRQFIYAGISVISLYLCYLTFTKGVGFFLVILLPVAGLTGFFAFPWGKDQPTEVWALAKIRFLLKPRKRIWNQSGATELVTITAPKKIEINRTNGLSQTEVRSRLRALADTIDSRGWAIKNSNVNLYGQQAPVSADETSDRLVAPSSLPQDDIASDIQEADDIMDEQNNASARRVNGMIEAAGKARRQRLMDALQKPDEAQAKTNNYWFLNQPSQSAQIPTNAVTFNTQVVTPGTAPSELPLRSQTPNESETELLHQLDAQKKDLPMSSYYGHLHTLQPLKQPSPTPPPTSPQTTQPQAASPMTPARQAAILNLAGNKDLNVATIAREAEVVVKLH